MLEVFISIMLLTGSVVLVLNKNAFTGEVIGEIDEKMTYILRTVQNDNSLREEILSAGLPVEWDDFEISGLTKTRDKIIEKTPPNLVCEAKVCALNDECMHSGVPLEKNIYSEKVYISADLTNYSPRKLKLFCWRK